MENFYWIKPYNTDAVFIDAVIELDKQQQWRLCFQCFLVAEQVKGWKLKSDDGIFQMMNLFELSHRNDEEVSAFQAKD